MTKSQAKKIANSLIAEEIHTYAEYFGEKSEYQELLDEGYSRTEVEKVRTAIQAFADKLSEKGQS